MQPRTLHTLAASLLTAVALAALPAAANAAAIIGMADQKPQMFSDQRFLSLDIKYARVSLPWDMLRRDFSARDADAWLSQARARGIRPLVAFQKSRVTPKIRPTTAEFVREFRRFRKKYPFVREFAAYNEPNLAEKRNPERVARYYLAMRSACRSCTILGGELVDTENMISWTRTFLRFTKGKEPRYWGLHNYVTVNKRSQKAANQLRRLVPRAEIWLSETGGLVARRSNSKIKIPEGVNHAAGITDFILKTWGSGAKFPRIYLYHWNSTTAKDTWDSAFIDPAGNPRPSYDVLRRYLGK
jgi:hypothetical protein